MPKSTLRIANRRLDSRTRRQVTGTEAKRKKRPIKLASNLTPMTKRTATLGAPKAGHAINVPTVQNGRFTTERKQAKKVGANPGSARVFSTVKRAVGASKRTSKRAGMLRAGDMALAQAGGGDPLTKKKKRIRK